MHNKPHTIQSRKLISKNTKIAMTTPEMFKKMSSVRFGRNRPIGIKDIKKCLLCGKKFNRPIRVGWKLWIKRLFCSRRCMGKGRPQNGENNPRFGVKATIETRRKQSIAHRGKKASGWKGGVTTINRLIRGSLEYRLWREAVFKRDNWTCKNCGVKGRYLHADHIKPFSSYPGLRFMINNGRTLCKLCHEKTETYPKQFRGL